jgi:Probable N6-adenine methyltransferase
MQALNTNECWLFTCDLQAIEEGRQRAGIYIFEYDSRFGESYPEQFVQYDFNEPATVPEHLIGACDYVLADPPYLNAQCIGEFFKTMQLLARHPWQQQQQHQVCNACGSLYSACLLLRQR